MTRGVTDDSGTLQLHIYRQNVHTFWVRMLKAAFLFRELLLRKRNLQHPLVYFYRRPLYRAGDRVDVKVMGREFQIRCIHPPSSAPRRSFRCWTQRQSVANRRCHAGCAQWRAGSFRLPENAVAGGDELRLAYRIRSIAAVFAWQTTSSHISRWFSSRQKRVQNWRSGQRQTALLYPDGEPVKNARVQLSLRASNYQWSVTICVMPDVSPCR